MNDKGYVSMDFLMSIIIFIFAILLLISQIPMLFAPLGSTVTDIQPVAYRTSMLLVDDGGLFYNAANGTLGSDWHLPENIDHTVRIGLAAGMHPESSSEDVVPLNLSRFKINEFNNSTLFTLDNITHLLGLNITYPGGQINYNFNISLIGFGVNRPLVVNNTDPLLEIGHQIPTGGVSVERIERIVTIDDATGLGLTTEIGGRNAAILVVYIWR